MTGHEPLGHALADPGYGNEFPWDAADPPDPVTRRQFLRVMGASAALAAGGCTRPPHEQIIPYVRQPEGIIPGQSRFYATTIPRDGDAIGVLVASREGRPIKIEGNERHPSSLGGTDAFAQAAILDLYDPDRSRVVMHGDRVSSWSDAAAALKAALVAAKGKTGHPFRVLSGAVMSPTLARERERFLNDNPTARWHVYEPVTRAAVSEGMKFLFGEDAGPVYRLENAAIILTLDADILASGPGHIRHARMFAGRRRVWEAAPAMARMNRLYAVGPTPSPTSASADHRLAIRSTDVAVLARIIAARLQVPGVPPEAIPDGRFPEDWIAALVADLRSNRRGGLVVAGDTQPPEVHALAHAINVHLDSVGSTVAYIPAIDSRYENDMGSLRELANDMRQGRVESLVILGTNPVFTAPADLEFAHALAHVAFRMRLGLFRDETGRRCHWHVPGTHFLEEWGDARAFNGTASIVQPLIAPLYDGVSALQLASVLRGTERKGYDMVRDYWRETWKDDFERQWNRSLQNGVIEGTAFAPRTLEPKANWWREPSSRANGLEITFRPDPTIHDGRYANNGWLQELPKPLTKLTWDAVAMMGPATARSLGLSNEIGSLGGNISVDLVELHYRGRSVEAPVWIQSGHAEETVTVHFGYGRTAAGRVGTDLGFDGYTLRTSDRPWFDSGLELRKTGRRYPLATTQLHHLMHGRDVVRSGTLHDYQSNPGTIAGRRPLPLAGDPPTLYEDRPYPGRKWGMVIDLTSCTGCSACVVACQAENNIPVVGKDQVARGREMHWLRIDTYHSGDAEHPGATFSQPVPCMQCENAPCEVVCPVNATVHSSEGLNDMVYNRCVGTRYCSNNCPYKVRRFNFLKYADTTTESLKPMRNPEVTIRSRGVMEKCTYCVQRIRIAEARANVEGELMTPGASNALMTACQSACPSGAIVFGDLNEIDSRVSRMRGVASLNYGLLADELGTRPRTTYLAALRNPNPDIKAL